MLASFEDELMLRHTNQIPELNVMINRFRHWVVLGIRFDSVIRLELHGVHYLLSGLNEDRPQLDFDRERVHQLRQSDIVLIVGLVPTELSPQAQSFQLIRNIDEPTLGNNLTLGNNSIQTASEKSLHVPSQPHKLNEPHATPVQENNSIPMDLKPSCDVTGVEKPTVNIEPPSVSNIPEPSSSSREATIKAIDFDQIPTAQEFAITQDPVSAPLTDAYSIQAKSPVQVPCCSSHTINDIAVSEAELKSFTDDQDALERLQEMLRKKRVDPQIPLQVASSPKIASKTLGERTEVFDSDHDSQMAAKKIHTPPNPNQDESCGS